MSDKIEWICDTESELLGINLTYSKLDSYNLSNINIECRDIKNLSPNTKVIVAAEIDNFNVVKIKNGPNKGNDMCFLSIKDSTAVYDSVIMFTDQLARYRNELFIGNVLIIQGKTGFKNGGLIIDKCYKPRG